MGPVPTLASYLRAYVTLHTPRVSANHVGLSMFGFRGAVPRRVEPPRRTRGYIRMHVDVHIGDGYIPRWACGQWYKQQSESILRSVQYMSCIFQVRTCPNVSVMLLVLADIWPLPSNLFKIPWSTFPEMVFQGDLPSCHPNPPSTRRSSDQTRVHVARTGKGSMVSEQSHHKCHNKLVIQLFFHSNAHLCSPVTLYR